MESASGIKGSRPWPCGIATVCRPTGAMFSNASRGRCRSKCKRWGLVVHREPDAEVRVKDKAGDKGKGADKASGRRDKVRDNGRAKADKGKGAGGREEARAVAEVWGV